MTPEKKLKEQTLRIGQLTRLLRRAEYIEKSETIVALEFDERTNLITLFLEEVSNG